MSEMEDRLRAALSARAELVQPEDLAPLATVTPLRPRWRPWVLLATAAVVLLVLGVVLQGLARDPRSDDVAPRPDEPRLELPQDVGRDWEPNELDRAPRLDLDGDGEKEEVTFRGEPTEEFDGRFRLETTLTSTGEEAYGLVEVGTTIATNVLDPIDADGDGDQELVLYYDDAEAVGGGGYPLVLDLRDGLLVQVVADRPELLVRGQVPVPGSTTEHYRMVHVHNYWFEDGALWSSRSVNAYAEGNMTLVRPETMVVDAWRWTLDEEGVLRPEDAGCLRVGLEASQPCGDDTQDELPYVTPVAEETFGPGESARFEEGYRYSARIEDGDPAVLVVEGDDGRTVRHELAVDAPRISTVQPMGVDGASFFVTSASDPSYVEVLAQDGDQLRELQAAGEVDLRNEGGARTWLTQNGGVFTVVEGESDTWQAWVWTMVSRQEMAAMPSATVCFDDVDDPSTVRHC
ncbi:hypothetical protein Pve01_61220 [Planomonospora venezuelensis]|nr:hypothetical protein Pve01_61220 [Planomonospora venezuelensis]